MKINKVVPADNNYALPLATIPQPPEAIYFLGTLPSKRMPSVAIVGTRKPTPYGKEVTESFARRLATEGIVVVSGLAIGVDGLAHRAALNANGITLAVLAGALPHIYPATHRQLAHDIVEAGGALLSEHGPDEHYTVGKWSFLQRNRLISGLADAILITEASASSGTLNTASHALEQGKEVFVIPGNITSPASAGCNALIKQGATPVTSPDDIIEIMLPERHKNEKKPSVLGHNPLESAIIAQLESGVREGDDLQQKLGIETSELNATLTMLELRGVITPLGANKWTIR